MCKTPCCDNAVKFRDTTKGTRRCKKIAANFNVPRTEAMVEDFGWAEDDGTQD